MFTLVSSSVLPVVMHLGRSGTYAAQLFSARSKMTTYLTFISCPPDPQPEELISWCRSAHRRPRGLGIVTTFGLFGCLKWRWLRGVRTSHITADWTDFG